jgi:1-aminocyclopropane-1-carboxylate deaminase/D-cysteine desulfhydrase-like pyridoxal-dependent ACC family enzyme
MNVFERALRFPRVPLVSGATAVEEAPRLGAALNLSLLIKRDDLTGLAFGGNKVRILEFYFGAACAEGADTVLITGSIQSNFARAAAAAAAKLGMACHIQLEERLPGADLNYRESGNVLLDELLGAVTFFYPTGEDEAGADRELAERAQRLRAAGRAPYVIPLGPDNPPLGALGYVLAAQELAPALTDVDAIAVGSGSGLTHAGLLFGIRALGIRTRIIGICVRRAARLQQARIEAHCEKLARMLECPSPLRAGDVQVTDASLGEGYGRLDDRIYEAVSLAARTEGLILDPTYTGKVLAGLKILAETDATLRGKKVLFIHTGGTPGLFAYVGPLRQRLKLEAAAG